jgi:hypothetical protein
LTAEPDGFKKTKDAAPRGMRVFYEAVTIDLPSKGGAVGEYRPPLLGDMRSKVLVI